MSSICKCMGWGSLGLLIARQAVRHQPPAPAWKLHEVGWGVLDCRQGNGLSVTSRLCFPELLLLCWHLWAARILT